MTELPTRPSSTRPPHDTQPPVAETRSPVSTTRTPFQPVPELVPAESGSTPLRALAILLLSAGLIVAGWYLLPHDPRTASPSVSAKNQTEEPNDRASGLYRQSASALPAIPGAPTTQSATNTADGREPGLRHIATLQLAGSYAQAADYAVASPLEHRRDFTIAAYHEWGRNQPEQAIASAIRIEEAFTRDFAMHSVLSGWARNDPEGMAETALAFPESDFKKSALTRALRAWMNKDPNLAGDWIMAHPDVVPIADEMFRRDRRD